MVEAGADGAANVRLTNRSIDVLKRHGTNWKIIRSFTIQKDGREVKSSCDMTLPKVSPDAFRNGAREVWQTLMRWRDSYNGRDLAGTLAPYDSSINGMYAGNQLDTFASLRESYTRYWSDRHRRPPSCLSIGSHGRASPRDGAQPRRGSSIQSRGAF